MIKGNVYLRWQGSIDSLAAIYQRLPREWQDRSVTTRVLIARKQRRPADALEPLEAARRANFEDPESFYSHALLRAQVYGDLGDTARARAQYDTARIKMEAQRPNAAATYRRLITLGLAYAGLGRAADAKRAADSAMVLMPSSRTVLAGTTAMRGAAEIFTLLPEYHGAAIDLLDQLMQMPAGREASVPFLRVDPTWDPLRQDPRFQRLLEKYEKAPPIDR